MDTTSLENLAAAVHFARTEHFRQMLIECAGLFWLLAEMIILLGVIAGRQHLELTPRTEHLRWTNALTRRAVVYTVAFVLLVCGALGRHAVLEPVHHYLESQVRAGRIPDTATVAALFSRRAREHLAVWGSFVTGWVVLETLIVYHGCRGYRRLKALLAEKGEAP